MIEPPLVSILMPVYNSAPVVGRAIQSILDQTFKDWELLICDDGSTDGSPRVITSFSDRRIKYYSNEQNAGSLLTRIFLLSQAKGDFIAFQDSDDFSLPDRLEKQVGLLNSRPEIALCGTWAKYKKNGATIKVKEPPVSYEEIRQRIFVVNTFCSASIMLRKSALANIGFRDYFKGIGNYDYDLTARIAQNHPCVNIPEYLYEVTVRANSNSRSDFDNPLKFESSEIVRILLRERMSKGKDSLDLANKESLREIEHRVLMPYNVDRWLRYDKAINGCINDGFYKEAFKYVFKSFCVDPFSSRPYHLLFYTLKRSIT